MKRFILALFCLIAGPSYAATVQEIKTPGGFNVWLVEEHSLPVVTMNVGFKGSGIAYDPPQKEGRTNLVTALLLEGAGELNATQFNEKLEENAIRLTIGADEDTTHASLETLSEHRDAAFSMLADTLIRPRFDDEPISRTRAKMKVMLKEQSESPAYKLTRAFQEEMFAAHPYARMGIGSDATLDALTKKDFTEFMAHYITRQNIIISVVGDVTPKEIATLVDEKFSGLPATYRPDTTLAETIIPSTADTRVIAHDMPQSMVRFGMNGLKRSDPDYIASYVANHIIGGDGLSSRLALELRIKRGLTYGIRTQMAPQTYGSLWGGMFSVKNQEAKNALAALREVLAQYLKNGVSEVELQDAKSYLTGSFILNLSSNGDVADFMTMMQLNNLGSDYLEKRNALIDAVTLADIKRVSERVIKPESLRIVIVGKPEL